MMGGLRLTFSLLLLCTDSSLAFVNNSRNLFAVDNGGVETRSMQLAAQNKGFKKLSKEEAEAAFQDDLARLESQQIPILGCDASNVSIFQAALWTTLSEISEKDEGEKVCIVFENIPQDALGAFCTKFDTLLGEPRIADNLPEFARINCFMVSEHGPALLLTTEPRTDLEVELRRAYVLDENFDQSKCEEALKSFVDRIVVAENVCPYTKDVNIAAVGLEKNGVTPGPIGYRFGSSSDPCAAMAAFWNSICELVSYPEEELSTTLLSLPAFARGTSDASLDRFAALTEFISHYLFLYRGADLFGLVYFHPAYDRSKFFPAEKPAFGQLPPRSWLRPLLRKANMIKEADNLTEEDLALSDHQRKSPFTMINILRTTQVNAAAGPASIFDLTLDDGSVVQASGLVTYTRNTARLANMGKLKLGADLEKDIESAFS